MENSIKNLIEKSNEKKTESISITLSKKILKELKKEMERLEIKNRSFVIEMILTNYFGVPEDENYNPKKEGGKSKKS